MPAADAILELIEKTLNNNRVFGDLLSAEHKRTLANSSILHPVDRDEILCRQNQISNSLFLIIKGEVEIVSDSKNNPTVLGNLGAGELIGEISALFQMPRIATVTTTEPSVVLEIPGNIFTGIITSNQTLMDNVIERCKNRVIETSLRCVPAFSELDKQSIAELCYISTLLKVQKDVVIAREGRTERTLYVICKGTARVYITIDDKTVPVALLQPGDYFGEYSLLTGEERNASVCALSDMQLVVLEGEAFESFIDNNEDTEHKINRNTYERLEQLDQMRGTREAAESRLNQVRNMLNI